MDSLKITAQQIADIVKGDVIGDPQVEVTGPGRIEDAVQGMFSFLSNDKYEKYIYQSDASVILVDKNLSLRKDVKATLVRVENVPLALKQLLSEFSTETVRKPGIDATAEVDASAEIGEGTHIGKQAIIANRVKIGNDTIIEDQVFIEKGVVIGNSCRIGVGVKIFRNTRIADNVIIHSNAVVGSDGFGFAKNDQGDYEKIPQLGGVIIEDDVEIGSNTVIDRGSIGNTILRKGCKLDNLIQVGHNVEIKKNTVIAAQVGISGSTTIGANCMVGGQAGFIGHIHIADGTQIQAQSGIAGNITEPDTKVYGSPAIGYQNYLRSYAAFKNLPQLIKELEQLKKDLRDKG